MSDRSEGLFSFPNPVNEVAARSVATGVVLLCAASIVSEERWLLVAVVYGFWARVLTGPTLSPLGQLATRVVAPRLSSSPRMLPGPPKRFAQGIGAVMSTGALVVVLTVGWGVAAWIVGALMVAASLEAILGLCVGCKIFALLMRVGVVPDDVCEECGDLSRRHPELVGR
ncbi:MAG: DUF4395 domain-containing protein [Acidimicrobiales bacterium]